MSKKPLEIDMCAGSQLRDTQGETLSVEGTDISELKKLNDNHGKGFFNSIGFVTESKKILKEEDCENERHRYYWSKVKAPYLYVRGFLHDDQDHPNALAAAAILRNIHKHDTPLQLKASVEGGVVARGIKDPSLLARTKIHSIALTFTPANNNTLVEPLSLDKSSFNHEADLELIKSVMHLAQTNIPSFRHIARDASAAKIQNNIKNINQLLKQSGQQELPILDKKQIINTSIENKIINNINQIHSSICLDPNHISDSDIADDNTNELEKGLKSALTASALALGLTGDATHAVKSPKSQNTSKITTPHTATAKTNYKPEDHRAIYQTMAAEHPIYGGIGGVETSEGKRYNKHVTISNPNSPHFGHTAGGIFGIMPIQGAFILNKVPELAKKYPDLAKAAKNIKDNHKQFTEKFNSDPTVAADFTRAIMNYNGQRTKNLEMLIYSWNHGLKGAWNKYHKTGMQGIINDPYVQQVVKHMHKRSKNINKTQTIKNDNNQVFSKALMAGYGGAGAPSALVSGSVMQTESLNTPNKFKYIVCDGCGKEQIHAKHQVKCRDCGQSFSFKKIYDVTQSTK